MQTTGEVSTAGVNAAQGQILGFKGALFWVATAVISFHAVYLFPKAGAMLLLYYVALVELCRTATGKGAFRFGFLVGFLIFAPQLYFFFLIFKVAAIPLWCVLALYHGLFTALGRTCLQRFGKWGWAMLPLLWLGFEYFRGELYYLRFSWMNAGYALAWNLPFAPLAWLGMYGLGFVFMVFAVVICRMAPNRAALAVIGSIAVLGMWLNTSSTNPAPPASSNSKATSGPLIAGIQLEFPLEMQIPEELDKVLLKHPDADILILSEYSFDGPVTKKVREWCRTHKKYLVAGGKDELPDGTYYNTAFVIGPDGEVLFRQGKKVPIQFFKDGLPAKQQALWHSPWGKIGICVCYDLSYTRVTDELIRQGAQALLVPMMDVVDWGAHQHNLHSRVGPVRAAEYGVPIFRLASSGISQGVDQNGRVLVSGTFPGQGDIVATRMEIGDRGSLPLDRYLAWLGVVTTALIIGLSVMHSITQSNDLGMRQR